MRGVIITNEIRTVWSEVRITIFLNAVQSITPRRDPLQRYPMVLRCESVSEVILSRYDGEY